MTTAAPEALDVMVFGESIVDFFPEQPGPPLVEVERYRRHLGGAPTNVAVGLARQGTRVGLMTLVGPEDFGRFVRARLAAEGVDTAAVGTHPALKTAITFVAVADNGDRSFLFFRHPSADQGIAPTDVDLSQIARARLFHVGSSTMAREPGRAATLAAVEAALSAGKLLSTDPNLRRHLWERPDEAAPLIRSILARADVVKLSDDELAPIVDTADPEAGARAVRTLGAKLVFVTMGARGCYYEGPRGRGYVPGEVVSVVDTTGAGDGFMAGVLATLAPRFAAGLTVVTSRLPLESATGRSK